MTILLDTPAGKRQAKIRLDGIDAPELGQPFSRRSRETLAGMVFDKACDVESRGGDRYGRTIGRVSAGETDVNGAMLEAGMAWHFKKYDDREDMAAREDSARAAGVGLWGGKDPVPPWEWRKMTKAERAALTGPPAARKAPAGEKEGDGEHWLSETGKRHNSSCRYFKTSEGRPCKSDEGTACKVCGG